MRSRDVVVNKSERGLRVTTKQFVKRPIEPRMAGSRRRGLMRRVPFMRRLPSPMQMVSMACMFRPKDDWFATAAADDTARMWDVRGVRDSCSAMRERGIHEPPVSSAVRGLELRPFFVELVP